MKNSEHEDWKKSSSCTRQDLVRISHATFESNPSLMAEKGLKGRKASKRESNLAEILVINDDSLNQHNTIQTYRNTDSRYIRKWDQQDSVMGPSACRGKGEERVGIYSEGHAEMSQSHFSQKFKYLLNVLYIL